MMGAVGPRLVVVSMVVLALVTASCSDSATVRAAHPLTTGADAPEILAYLALCSVRDAASAGDVATAEATFEDDAHETLHHVADEVEGTDRAAAAGLLQAKSDVEADFAQDAPDPSAVSHHVEALLSAMGDALEVVGLPAPGCKEPQP